MTNSMSPLQTIQKRSQGVVRLSLRHMMTTSPRDIIVIGASAGGVEALCTVTSALPRDLPAAVFIVLHIPAWRDSFLPAILSRCSHIPALHPQSGDLIERGRIYVAPPDQHLLIDSEKQVQLWHGPKENGCRPSINALFRSAAETFGPRVTGVVLTGSLDDGTTGLWWIKQRGGAVIVQDPAEAEFAQMPKNALAHVPADYVAKLVEIGPTLDRLARLAPRADEKRMEGRAI